MDSKQPTLSQKIVDREVKSFIEEVSRPPQTPRNFSASQHPRTFLGVREDAEGEAFDVFKSY